MKKPYKYEVHDVGMIIRYTRLKKGITQTDLAHRMGRTNAQISKMETSQNAISIATMLKAFKALGVEWRIDIPYVGKFILEEHERKE